MVPSCTQVPSRPTRSSTCNRRCQPPNMHKVGPRRPREMRTTNPMRMTPPLALHPRGLLVARADTVCDYSFFYASGLSWSSVQPAASLKSLMPIMVMPPKQTRRNRLSNPLAHGVGSMSMASRSLRASAKCGWITTCRPCRTPLKTQWNSQPLHRRQWHGLRWQQALLPLHWPCSPTGP